MKCQCCENVLVREQDFLICRNCKAIFTSPDTYTDYNKLVARTQEVVNDFQEFLLQHNDVLHNLTQKKISGKELSQDEIEIIEFSEKFLKARIDFLGLPHDTSLFCRKVMYTLLVEIQENIPQIKEKIKNTNI